MASVVGWPAGDAQEVKRFDVETDVLVVGLGAAGAAAAIGARRAGARVLVLERAGGGGGTSALSGGVLYLGGGTPIQKQCGFDDSPEAMFRYLMASCGPRPDEAKVRLYCEGSVEHYHWLVGLGVPFKPVFYPHYSGEPPTEDGLVFSGSEEAWPFRDVARPAPRGHVPRIPGQAGGLLMQKLIGAVEALGAEVQVGARCEALLRDPNGAIVGALHRVDGRPCSVRARRGVVLATGGFINHREMVETWAPLLRQCRYRVGGEGDDGSGIRLGMAAGAATLNMEQGSISLPIHPPKRTSAGVLINAQGQRFINEDVYYGRLGESVVTHQDGVAFLVMDDASFVRPEVSRDLVGVADRVEDLEEALGLPPRSLVTTLELYNHHAARGEDPVFHKRSEYLKPLTSPPFGAFDCRTESSLYAVFTLGGLRTDADGAVLDGDGRRLPGLYAAGRCSAGLAAPGYSSGLSLGDGTFFGRRAGAAAASCGSACGQSPQAPGARGERAGPMFAHVTPRDGCGG
ncbi:MAG: FAD-dependent oxidoreductase [Myxococcota bacterium]